LTIKTSNNQTTALQFSLYVLSQEQGRLPEQCGREGPSGKG
jgi:hypothetical protein